MRKHVRTEDDDENIMFEDDPRAQYEDNAIYRRKYYE
jgi:hypothetical protein